jgi:hypothetical protein
MDEVANAQVEKVAVREYAATVVDFGCVVQIGLQL